MSETLCGRAHPWGVDINCSRCEELRTDDGLRAARARAVEIAHAIQGGAARPSDVRELALLVLDGAA